MLELASEVMSCTVVDHSLKGNVGEGGNQLLRWHELQRLMLWVWSISWRSVRSMTESSQLVSERMCSTHYITLNRGWMNHQHTLGFISLIPLKWCPSPLTLSKDIPAWLDKAIVIYLFRSLLMNAAIGLFAIFFCFSVIIMWAYSTNALTQTHAQTP